MPTMTTSDPTEITLLLAVHGGGDLGPFAASLRLNKPEVEQLLRWADHHRIAAKLEPRLYQTTYFDYGPKFFEQGKTEDVSPEDLKKLEEFFENENYPTDGIREAAPGEVPGSGTVRLDYCKLLISACMLHDRPDKVDYRWVACIKHTDVEIETAELTEEVVRALLARLA